MKHIATKHFTKWLDWFDQDSQAFTDNINKFIEKEQQREGVANFRIIDIKHTVTADPQKKDTKDQPTFLMTALVIYEWDIIKISK